MSLADETALLWEEVETDGPSLAGAAAPAAWAVEGPVGTQPKEPSAKNISSGRGSGRKPKRVFSSSERIKRATLRESSEVLLDIADRVPFGCVRSHSEHVSPPPPLERPFAPQSHVDEECPALAGFSLRKIIERIVDTSVGSFARG